MDKNIKPIWIDIKNEGEINRLVARLVGFKGGPFISMYLPNVPNENFLHRWNSLYHIERRDAELAKISENRKREIIDLLDSLDFEMREIGQYVYYHTLAIFMGKKFMYIVDMPILEEEVLNISRKIFLQPLENHLKDVKSLVFCVDRTEAEIFSLYLGRFGNLLGEMHTDVPQKVRGGTESWRGVRDNKIARHIEWHLDEHIKKVSKEFMKIYKKENPGKIYLGGHDRIIPKVFAKLPKAVREKVAGKFRAEPDIFLQEAKARGFEAIEKHLIK